MFLAATLVAGVANASGAIAPAVRGPSGSLTALVIGGEWPNLDPALNTQDAADAALMNAIYGGLFEFGPKGQVIPDEATGYKFLNHGMTFEITLRRGLKFSDGVPMDATAVAKNITRDLLPANACICGPDFAAVSSVTASGPSTVVMQLSRPFPSLVYSFDDTAPNWTADLSDLARVGTAAFGQTPVGAGPFKIVSNAASATLRLTANPHYWQAHHPLVKNLTFTSVGADSSAYDSVESGQAAIALGVTTIPLVKQARRSSSMKVVQLPATQYNFVELNAKTAPFNNITAREAIFYATDVKSLVKELYANLYVPVQSPTAPGESIYIPKIPGFRTYNLTKAKALVRQLGGLSFTLGTLTNTPYWATEVQALAAQWGRAGITANLNVQSLQNYLQELRTNNWQALDTNWGAASPAIALPSHFSSTAPLSGVADPVVDSIMNQAAATVKRGNQIALYTRLAQRLSSNADAVMLYSKSPFEVVAKRITGISPKQNDIFWENVR